MMGEYTLNEHTKTTEKETSVPKIVTKNVEADSRYAERVSFFKSAVAETVTADVPQEEIVNKVVEAALLSEFTDEIKNFPTYDHMKDTIAAALLRDGDLKEKILSIVDKNKAKVH